LRRGVLQILAATECPENRVDLSLQFGFDVMEVTEPDEPTGGAAGEHVKRRPKTSQHLTKSDCDFRGPKIVFFLDFELIKRALVIETCFLAIPMGLWQFVIFSGLLPAIMTGHTDHRFRVRPGGPLATPFL